MHYPSSGVHRASQATISSSIPRSAGRLVQKNATVREIYINQDLTIGRDRTKCNFVIDDPCVSRRHLRLYTIIYENDGPEEIDTLVYAEDLSQNGTFWNGSLIGRGNGGFLLSDADILHIGPQIRLEYKAPARRVQGVQFDLDQEREMALFSENYIITDRLLGAGAFGKVFMAIDQTQRKQLACKIIDLQNLGLHSSFKPPEEPADAGDVDVGAEVRKIKTLVQKKQKGIDFDSRLRSYYREIQILSTLSHPNIISLDRVYVTDSNIYIFEDLITAGDLFSYLEWKQGKLEEVEAAVIIRQITIALVFLHQNNVVHRDLKPDNVLMTSQARGSRIVLTDFGAARRIENKRQRMDTMVGTEEYVAPEVLNPPSRELTGYTRAADLWSLGCVTVVLLTGGSAFADPITNIYSEELASACNLEVLQSSPEWHTVRQRPREFVQRLLVLDERQRMTAKQSLEHPWFSNDIHRIDFEKLYERSIRGWKPRTKKDQMISFVNSVFIKNLSCSKSLLQAPSPPSRSRGKRPVEPPYIPFPRQMHLSLWPPRKEHPFEFSSEVQTAIREFWTPNDSTDRQNVTEQKPVISPLASEPATWSGTLPYTSTHDNPKRSTLRSKLLQPSNEIQTYRPYITERPIMGVKMQQSKDDIARSFTAVNAKGLTDLIGAAEACRSHDKHQNSIVLASDNPFAFQAPARSKADDKNVFNIRDVEEKEENRISGKSDAGSNFRLPPLPPNKRPSVLTSFTHLQDLQSHTPPSAQPRAVSPADSSHSERWSSPTSTPSPSPRPQSSLKRPSLHHLSLDKSQTKRRRTRQVFDFDIEENDDAAPGGSPVGVLPGQTQPGSESTIT